jgi:type II secretory pathway pseudopilin PulG
VFIQGMSGPAQNKSETDIVAWLIALGLVGLILAVVFPNFIKARSTRASNSCINNLRQIDSAAIQFALENGKKTGDNIVFPDDLTPYVKLNTMGKIPSCPDGGIYHIAKVGDKPTCSLSSTMPWHALP